MSQEAFLCVEAFAVWIEEGSTLLFRFLHVSSLFTPCEYPLEDVLTSRNYSPIKGLDNPTTCL
jgi:hypothetical protein